ncbi:hypothetical protein BRADI_5g12466v3 [Brachypodium distachyon]|uniref:Uncharacterized protein n=1 Tax=Brachypodium distachyon TaxID=15368 RepID=A0A0Q3KSA4_BRADI|nr:hypothetical protein BRADI_5g12466v3 [Brachypodium distachyon]
MAAASARLQCRRRPAPLAAGAARTARLHAHRPRTARARPRSGACATFARDISVFVGVMEEMRMAAWELEAKKKSSPPPALGMTTREGIS